MSWTIQTVLRNLNDVVVVKLRNEVSISLIAAMTRSETDELTAVLLLLSTSPLEFYGLSSKDIRGILSSTVRIVYIKSRQKTPH